MSRLRPACFLFLCSLSCKIHGRRSTESWGKACLALAPILAWRQGPDDTNAQPVPVASRKSEQKKNYQTPQYAKSVENSKIPLLVLQRLLPQAYAAEERKARRMPKLGRLFALLKRMTTALEIYCGTLLKSRDWILAYGLKHSSPLECAALRRMGKYLSTCSVCAHAGQKKLGHELRRK